jgi:hypothetical protein
MGLNKLSHFLDALTKFKYNGVVLNNSSCSDNWDSGSVTFCNVFVDDENPKDIFLYYTGININSIHRSSIGLAISSDGLNFRKIKENPILEGTPGTFFSRRVSTPAVTKIGSKYYMVFSGQSNFLFPRYTMSLGIAWADDPVGPWKVIGELIKPEEKWEGRGIDNGPAIVHLNNDSFLIFYSNCSLKYSELFLQFIRNPTYSFSPQYLYRYIKRKVGILKVRIRGTDDVEAYRYKGNPLIHLNGPIGSWNESIFCPGYAKFGSFHYLFPATSTYSRGYPFPQYIATIVARSPFFEANSVIQTIKTIDGSDLKGSLQASIGVALDTPNLIIRNNKLLLYYSVMARDYNRWKIALSSADI